MKVYELIHELQRLAAEGFADATVEARNDDGDWDYVPTTDGAFPDVNNRGVTVVRIAP